MNSYLYSISVSYLTEGTLNIKIFHCPPNYKCSIHTFTNPIETKVFIHMENDNGEFRIYVVGCRTGSEIKIKYNYCNTLFL